MPKESAVGQASLPVGVPACLESDAGVLRIATRLLDVPAETIAMLSEYRWTIEIFFRFFKHVLGCRHLLSHDEHGIKIQTYCAIIACMLISLWTGRKPTLRTCEMICFSFCGLATEDELLAHIGRLRSEGGQARRPVLRQTA